MRELMINDTVHYSFGHAIKTGKIVGIKIVTEIIQGKRTGVFTETFYTVMDNEPHGAIRSDFKAENFETAAYKKLEKLRKALHDENISYGELAELQDMKDWIEADDVELLEAAGVPEEVK